jgi:[acyl-carrier-protein] S-malonyltransferase
MRERAPLALAAAAGLSLGEYTALHLAGAFSFEDGLRLVALRGRFMQDAAEASQGGMVALIGADEDKALEVCAKASQGEVLVCANFNAPGQIVLSGHATACDRAVTVAGDLGLRATKLVVAGAFHSPLMQPAAERLAKALDETAFSAPSSPVWSNVTARPHGSDPVTIKQLLVQQLTAPVRWSQSCTDLIASVRSAGTVVTFREVAPGTVLKGLMKRIDRTCEVTSHDQPDPVTA